MRARPLPVASNATFRTEGDTLLLAGVIDREAVVALWPQLTRALAPVRLGGVARWRARWCGRRAVHRGREGLGVPALAPRR